MTWTTILLLLHGGALWALWALRVRLAGWVLRREVSPSEDDDMGEDDEHGGCEHCALLRAASPADVSQIANWIGLRAHRENPNVGPESIWAGILMAAVMVGRSCGVPREALLHAAEVFIDTNIEVRRLHVRTGQEPS